MYKYLIFLIYLHFIRAQLYNRFPSFSEENAEDWNQNYYKRKFRTRSVDHSPKKNEFPEEYHRLSVLDTALISDVQTRITKMKTILNEDLKKVTSLDGKNEEIAKKHIGEIQQEINYRVGYVKQLLYKKRGVDSATNTNLIKCVSESISKLNNIIPDLTRNADRCINNEIDHCREHTKTTLDLLKERIQKVKHHQERLNECSSLIKLRNPCLIKLVQEIATFKKNINTSLKSKIADTAHYLSGLPRKVHMCSSNTISKVVTYASDVVVKFNSCIKGAALDEEKKQLEEMMLFIV